MKYRRITEIAEIMVEAFPDHRAHRFLRWDIGSPGSKPTGIFAPNGLRIIKSQYLKTAESNAPKIDKTFDCVSCFGNTVLLAFLRYVIQIHRCFFAQSGHRLSPIVITKGTQKDNQKNILLNDPRVSALKQLATIDLLPENQLNQLLSQINSLKTCWSLTKNDLEYHSICPHCKFRPKDEQHGVVKNLNDLADKLQGLLEDWTGMLQDNINYPEVKDNISLLKPEQQDLINILLAQKEFTLPVDVNLVYAIKELLQGIEPIEITVEDLMEMAGNGSPLTVEEVRLRLEKLLKDRIGSQSANRVRVMLGHK